MTQYRDQTLPSEAQQFSSIEDRIYALEKEIQRRKHLQPYTVLGGGEYSGTSQFRPQTLPTRGRQFAILLNRLEGVERDLPVKHHLQPFTTSGGGEFSGVNMLRAQTPQNTARLLAEIDGRTGEVEKRILSVGKVFALVRGAMPTIRTYNLSNVFLYECAALTKGNYRNYSVRVGECGGGLTVRTDNLGISTFTRYTNTMRLSALAIDANDNIYSAGQGTGEYGIEGPAPFMKWNAAGALVWGKKLRITENGGSYTPYIRNMCFNPITGGVAFAGNNEGDIGFAILGEIDSGGGITQFRLVNDAATYASGITVDDLGNYWYSGHSWIGRANSILNSLEYTFFQDDVALDCLVSKNGKIYASGRVTQGGNRYGLIMKWRSNGSVFSPEKIIRIGPMNSGSVLSHVCFDDNDNVYADGFGGNYGVIVKLDSSDNLVWQKGVSYSGLDHLDGVRTNNDNVFAAGNYGTLYPTRWWPIILNCKSNGEIPNCGILFNTNFTAETTTIGQDVYSESTVSHSYSMEDFTPTSETLAPTCIVVCGG